MFFEFIFEFVFQGIFEKLLKGFFWLNRRLGIFILKVITLNPTSFEKLDKEYYKDSSKPYLIVFFLIVNFHEKFFFW